MYDTYRTLQRRSWPSGRLLEFFSVFFQRRQSSSTFSVPQKLPSRYNLKDRLSILRFAFYGNSGCTKWFHLGRARTFSEYQDETLWTLGCRVFAGLLPQKTPTSKCPWHDLVNSNKMRLTSLAQTNLSHWKQTPTVDQLEKPHSPLFYIRMQWCFKHLWIAPKTPVEHTYTKRRWPPQNESKWWLRW